MDLVWIVFLEFFSVGHSVILYPFGTPAGDSLIYANELAKDVSLSGTFKFYGHTHSPGSSVRVATYGTIITSGYSVWAHNWFAQEFPITPERLIALFWDDMDPDHTVPGNKVYYRQTTDSDLLQQITQDIRGHSCGCAEQFNANWGLIVTYFNVKPYNWTMQHNTCQVVLVSDDKMTFTIFLYDKIEWTGRWTPGAQVGFNSGDGRSFTLPGALTPRVGMLQIRSNVGVPGVWLHRVDRDFITDPCDPDACVCEYGEDLVSNKIADLVTFSCSLTGLISVENTMVERANVTDPCRFKLAATTKEKDSVFVLERIKFQYGMSPGEHRTFSRYIKIGGPDMKFFNGTITEIDLHKGPFEDRGPPRMKLTMIPGGAVFLESEDCPWKLVYRLEWNEKVAFYTGEPGPFEGKCGTC